MDSQLGLFRINQGSNVPTLIDSDQNIIGLASAPGGSLIGITSGNSGPPPGIIGTPTPGSVFSINPQTGIETPISTGATGTADGPWGSYALAVDANGYIFFTGQVDSQLGLFRINQGSNVPTLIDSDQNIIGLSSPALPIQPSTPPATYSGSASLLTLDSFGAGDIITVSQTGTGPIKITLPGNESWSFGTGGWTGSGVSVESSGNILDIDPTTFLGQIQINDTTAGNLTLNFAGGTFANQITANLTGTGDSIAFVSAGNTFTSSSGLNLTANGNITVSEPVTVEDAVSTLHNLSLTSTAGNITETGTAIITAALLTTDSATGTTLSNNAGVANNVASFNGTDHSTLGITLTDAVATTAGGLTITGISETNTGPVIISNSNPSNTTGSIYLASVDISATNAAVSLSAPGGVLADPGDVAIDGSSVSLNARSIGDTSHSVIVNTGSLTTFGNAANDVYLSTQTGAAVATAGA